MNRKGLGFNMKYVTISLLLFTLILISLKAQGDAKLTTTCRQNHVYDGGYNVDIYFDEVMHQYSMQIFTVSLFGERLVLTDDALLTIEQATDTPRHITFQSTHTSPSLATITSVDGVKYDLTLVLDGTKTDNRFSELKCSSP
jgi:hypothetical protein